MPGKLLSTFAVIALTLYLINAYALGTEPKPDAPMLNSEYEKGLITINPAKSVYPVGEKAVIYMVVLDEKGRPVKGANVEMTVTSPKGLVETIASDHAGEDGIYKTAYKVLTPGTHLLFATAVFGKNTVHGETSFLADSAPRFEIIRSTPLKIDPRLGPFSSSIKVLSSEEGPFTLVESLPEEFNVTDSGGAVVSTVDNKKILIWEDLRNNSNVAYSVRAPLLWPYLFELGPAEIEYGTETFIESRAWQIASDPSTTIQPAEADSYMVQDKSNKNYGGDDILHVKSELRLPQNQPKNRRVLLSFDLSNIPAGTDVESAILELYVDRPPGDIRTYAAHRLTSNWTEGTGTGGAGDTDDVTWDSNTTGQLWLNSGGDYVATAANMTDVTTTDAVWVSWNITEVVRGWHNGTYPNYGVLIKDIAENSTTKYETKFASNLYASGEYPRLIVNYTDINPPLWDNQSQSKDAPNIGDEVILKAQGWDDFELSYAWLETNETGSFENKSGVYGSPMYLGDVGNTWTWSSFTWSNGGLGGGTGVTWRIWYNDSYGNVNKTDYMNFTVVYQDTPPQWRNPGQSTSTPAVKDDVKLYAQGQDETSLEFAWLETNETGAPRNYTGIYGGVYGSPRDMGGATTWTWSNFTWNNDSLSAGDTVQWRIWYNDSSGQVNVTSYQQFTLQTPSTTIQPSEKDSFIDENKPDTNYGTDVELKVKSRGGGRNMRSILQFDISSLPSGISIDSAVLELYVTDKIPGATRTYNAHRLTNSWVESEVTWNTRLGATTWNASGGDFIGAATASANAGTSTYVWVSWNITNDVRGWYNGSYNNYGTLIKDSVESDGNNEIRFVSKDNSTDSDLHPRLLINYSYLPDLNPPMWRNQDQSSDTPNVGEEIILSAQGKDDVALAYAVLETDESGTPENKTGVYGSPMYMGDVTETWVWSNFTWANDSVPDTTVVTWRIWYNDSSGRWNVTDPKSFTVTLVPGPPKWRYQSQSDDEPYEGQEVILSAQGYDESSLQFAWLETNETGVDRNYTNEYGGFYGSPMYMGGGPGWKWSNFTWLNSSVKQGETVRWRIWYNDSLGNVNKTAWKTFLVTEPKIIIQPSNMDSHMREDRPDNNYGSDTEIRVRTRSNNRNYRSLVQFDLSSIPQGLSIDSAILELYTTKIPSSLRTYDVHRLTSGWTESGVTWNSRDGSNNWGTAGGDYTTTSTNSTQAGLDLNAWVSWNITLDVRGWYNGTYPNYGTLIKDSAESSAVNYEIRFASKEYATTTYQPRLIVRFTPDTTRPQWRNQGWNASSSKLTQVNRTVNLSAQGFDNLALSYAWLATNETGVWVNKSGVYGSPMYLGDVGNTWTWSNFTWKNPSLSPGTTVGWRIYYNDTAGNINGTDILSFTLVSWDSYSDAAFQNPSNTFCNTTGTIIYHAGYGFEPDTVYNLSWYKPNGNLRKITSVKSNSTGWINASLTLTPTDAAGTYHAVVYFNRLPPPAYTPSDPEIIADDLVYLEYCPYPEFGIMAIPLAASGALYLWMRRRRRMGIG